MYLNHACVYLQDYLVVIDDNCSLAVWRFFLTKVA